LKIGENELKRRLRGDDTPDVEHPAVTPGRAPGHLPWPAKEVMAGDENEEIRVLDIDRDTRGIRFKNFRDAVGECTVQNWPDSPLDNPPTTLSLVASMERQHGDPLRWFAAWTLSKKIQEHDRTYHEMLTYCRALYYSLTYDQLNVGSLVCLEILAQRVQGPLDAYEEAPHKRPDFSAVRLFTGAATFENAVPKEMRQYVNRKAREEHDIALFRQRARHGTLSAVADDIAGDGPGDDGAAGQDGTKGGRRGNRRAGKGLPPAQAK